MIAPELIDEIAERVSDYTEVKTAEKLAEIQAKQPTIAAYILSEDETYLFSEAEKTLLYYLVITIWETVKVAGKMPQRVALKRLDALQFDNWTALETFTNPKGMSLDDYFEPVIGEHVEAELLYFVCDGLEEEDEEDKIIAKDSLLPIFIMLKTVVDCLTLENKD